MNKAKKHSSSRSTHKRATNAAARYLELLGYEIVERDWKCPSGRIDLIARDGEELVFVTVKARKSSTKGFPSDVVSDTLRERFEKAAYWYLKEGHDFVDIPVRLDMIALLVLGEDRAFLRHAKNVLSSC